MRIAYLVSSFPSLSETFVLNQLTGLIDRGHEVDVLAQRRGECLEHPDLKRYGLTRRVTYPPVLPTGRVLRIAKAGGLVLRSGWRRPGAVRRALELRRYPAVGPSLRLLYNVAALIPGRRYDAIHCHFGPNGILAAALREVGVLDGPIVTTFHAYDLTKYVRKWGRGLYEHLFAVGDLFLTISEHWRGRLVELECPPERIRLHHMGVRCDGGERPATSAEPGRPVRLLGVGRFVEKKGFADAVRAVGTLRKRGIAVTLDLIGEGPLGREIEALRERLGLVECVRLLGPKSQVEVAAALRDSDILVSPSVTAADGDQEGIPVVLMEAMAAGLPVVSTRHSGIPELVADGRSGYLVAEHDVQGLADKLAVLIADPEQRRAMGQTGAEIVAAEFNIETLNAQLEGILRTCAAHAPRGVLRR